MSDVKSKFTLHTEYKDFVPGQYQPEFPTKALSPHIRGPVGFMIVVLVSALVLVLLICDLFILGMAIYSQRVDYQMLHEGHEVSAFVTACSKYPDSDNRLGASYTYTYSVSDVVYEDSDSLHESCDAHPIGSTIVAVYHASDPARARINFDLMRSNEGAYGYVIFMLGGSGLGISIILWLFGTQIKRYLYAHRHRGDLATNSQILQGEITAINGHKPYNPDAYYVCVWYTFETPRKKILKGYAEAHRQDLRAKICRLWARLSRCSMPLMAAI